MIKKVYVFLFSFLCVSAYHATLYSQSKSFTAVGRPSSITEWIRKKRSMAYLPPTSGHVVCGVEWWGWWSIVQPKWHVRDSNGRLALEGTGSWKSLKIGGVNGLLLFLTALAWWGKEAMEGGGVSEDWENAVKDVCWALECCVAN